MKESNSKLLKQRLFRMHVSVGITFSLLMYISIFFGIFTIMLPYIQTWEKPSRHFKQIENYEINYSEMIDSVLDNPDFPKNNIIITLPGTMGDPALKISHRFTQPIIFNPYNAEKIIDEKEQSSLAKFLNELHYAKPLKLFGRILFGLLAVAVMFIVITGVILITILKFKNRGKNQQAIFSKFHIKIFTWVFPPFLIITLTGAVMNIGLLSGGPMAYILSEGKVKSIDGVVGPVLFQRNLPVKKIDEVVKMKSIDYLINKAKKINPNINFQEIRLISWTDKSAQVEIKGYNPTKPFLNGGIFNKPKITLSAYTGKLINHQKVMDRDWGVFVAEATFFLHLLFGVDVFIRFFIATLMLASCLGIGLGVMLWLEKKAKKFGESIVFYHWMSKLSLTIMIGIIPATAILFNLQWLLPFDIVNRVLLQQVIFYNSWLVTLFWSFYRISSHQAVKELLSVGGVLFILAPILHYIFSGFNPISLVTNGMGNILSVDTSLFILGVILIYISKKLPNNRDEAKLFWITKKAKQ